ncbi:PilX N-terminal domain-containing pilus assembly protein [Pseudomonas sp. 8Z]|uniref:PilX N-terminal domain-containing pilus assembly protein n=1 Tax=Pseudomonas sp. 8Z TaxID=2653166 RepID=UPI0021138F9E|nr:PilX N-terminal domain-containing pilus assembly protein [Pseudomonas sp. 8Z]
MKRQEGAVLLVALVMLVVITLLAVGSMRNVTLETRITANRAQTVQLENAADAALREAEFRYYGPGNIADKLTPSASNCSTANTLRSNNLNKPCLLEIVESKLQDFVEKPWIPLDSALGELSQDGLSWMPYRGTDAANTTSANSTHDVAWNSTLAPASKTSAINAEYGDMQSGKGTYFYLNNAKATPKAGIAGPDLYLQSSHGNIYLGINN